MNTQLEQISELFLNKPVTDKEVISYLDLLISTTKNPETLLVIKTKLAHKKTMLENEKVLLLEILKNVNVLFRTYGKRSDTLIYYMDKLKLIN